MWKMHYNCILIAWKCLNKCVKVSPIEFLPRINTFLVFNKSKLAEITKLFIKLCKSVWIGVGKYHLYNSDHEYIFFGTHYVKNFWKCQILWKIMWKLYFDCMHVCDWVYKSIWKYFKWFVLLNFVLFGTKNVEIRPWIT